MSFSARTTTASEHDHNMNNPSSVSPSSSNTPGASRGSLNGAELASFASRAISTCRVELEQDSEHDDFCPATSPPKCFLLKPLPKKNACRAISTCRVEKDGEHDGFRPAGEHDDFRPATSPREPGVLGLHRLGRAHGEEDEDEGSKEDDDASTSGETNRACRQILAKEIPCAPRPLSNRTSTTISSVVQFIGTRMHEAYTEAQTPQNDSGHPNSVGDTDHVTNEVIFPQDNQMKMNNSCLFEGDEQTARSHWSTARISSPENCILSKRVGDLIEPNILQKAFASEPLSGHPPAFLLVRVHPNKSEQAHDAKPKPAEEVDQNAVAEWWSNLFKFQPGAPSQQARLIRSTHEKLADILLKKDERIESLHAQTIDLERNSKAAMLYSYTIIADLEASRTALSLFGESVLQDLRFVYSELACSAAMQEKCGIFEKRLQTSERESAAEIARLNEKNRVLEERNRVLEKRTQMSERESAAEIARLNAEIHRLKSLLNQQQQAPKLVGIGMRITNDPPHRVTEIVAGGAAYQSGEIAVGDYILQVGNMDIRHYPIEQILKNILGPAGSYLDLRLDRRDENEESNVFTVTIKRSEIVPTGLAHKALNAHEPFRSPLAPRTIQSIAERTVLGGTTESGSSVVQKKRPASSGFGVFGPSAPGPLF